MKDTYWTITASTIGEFKDKGSKFIAYTCPLQEEPMREFAEFMENTRKLHPKARHFCYAWRVGMDKNAYRSNDDGEPSGTAGKPILGQIDSFGLTNVAVIVVRYFGGTLLGTSGLINAYKKATAEALKEAILIEKILMFYYTITFGYDKMPDVMNSLKLLQIDVVKQSFTDKGEITIAIRQSQSTQIIRELWANIFKISVESVEKYVDTEGVEIVQQE